VAPPATAGPLVWFSRVVGQWGAPSGILTS
jgi:hypothetical protein